MTIPSTASEISYAGDGVSTVFAIPFVFDTSADLKVVETSAAGVPTVVTTGFSVTGGGGSTGTLTRDTALPSGTTLNILDDPERTQPADYTDNDAFPAAVHEGALDRVTRIAKRLHERVDRSIRVADGDLVDGDSNLLPISSVRAGKFLSFDANGAPTVASGTGGGDSALRTDLASTTSGADGSRLVGFRRTEIGAVGMSIRAVLAGALITPQMFGAVGDGVTDDSTALQAALNTGLSVFILPDSTFLYSTGIAFTAANQSIVGVGQASKLKYTGSGTGISFAGFDYCKVDSINLWAPSAAKAIYVGNIAHAGKVLGCRINGCSTGADFSGGTRNSGTAIEIEQSFYVEIDGNDIAAFAKGVYGFNQCNGNFITNNSIRRCNRGVHISSLTANSDGNSISHNEIEGGEAGDLYGIDLEGCSNNTVAENRMEYTPNGTAHIYVHNHAASGTAAVRNELLHNHCVGQIAAIKLGDNSGANKVVATTVLGGWYDDAITIGVDCDYTTLNIGNNRALGNSSTPPTNNSTTSRITFYNDQSFAVGITGGTTTPTANWTYAINNGVVTIEATQLVVTSNTTACTITGLPTLIRPSSSQTVIMRLRDNSANVVGLGVIDSSGVITLSNSMAGAGAMTNGNDKGVMACTITYRLP